MFVQNFLSWKNKFIFLFHLKRHSVQTTNQMFEQYVLAKK